MRKVISASLIVVFLFNLSGCASIVSGKKADLRVNSNPAKAEVFIDDMPVGRTPLVVEVKRKKKHTILIRKDGFEDEIRMTKRGFNWWFLGSVALLSIVGVVIDIATGAIYSLKPDEINVQLKEKA